MAKKRSIVIRLTLSFVTGLALIGCSPLEQAPLVYSSKVVVGIDVSTPTSEQPGASISLGVKMVDAAYVPVAVAKNCDDSTILNSASNGEPTSNCENLIYQIKPIEGTSSSSDDKTNNAGQENAAKIAALSAQVESLNRELIGLKAQETTAIKNAADAAAKTIASSTLGAEQAVTPEQVEAEVVSNQVTQKTKQLEQVVEQLKSTLSIDRKDSYSVFGSFDSSTKTGINPTAKTADLDLNLGKVFSTGVAAQNLTEGLGKQFANSACLAAA